MKHLTTVLFLSLALVAPAMAAPPVFNGNVFSAGMPTFNVKFYGAKGDGTTDDSAAIQAANNAASAACGTLYFPPSANNYYYNSATPIVIATCETVYGPGATIAGGASATGDAIQYAGGNHTTIDVLPNVGSFGGACLHLLPGASLTQIYVSDLNHCNIGLESESNASNANLDNTITASFIASNTEGIEIRAASASDVQQGNIFNVNFVDANKYSLEFNTPSGTLISPTGIDINIFNLAAIDGANVTGSIGIYAVTNFKVNDNYVNTGSFFGGFAVANQQLNGGVNDVGIIERIVGVAQQFNGPLSSFQALSGASLSVSGNATVTGGSLTLASSGTGAFIQQGGTGNLLLQYTSGSGSVIFGNGASGTNATINSSGLTEGSSVYGPTSLSVNGGATISGNTRNTGWLCLGPNPCNLANAGDVSASRSSTTGYMFFGSNASNYLGFDGTAFQFSAGPVHVPSGACTGGIQLGTVYIFSSTGAPSCTAVNGSLYLRSDGTAGARMYVSAGSGTWTAVSGV